MGTIAKGITLKENGKYLARKRVGNGKRISKEFKTLTEAKMWLEGKDITTVGDFFIFWIETLMASLRINTKLSYTHKYNNWIGPVIGDMDITKVRPMDCMEVLSRGKNCKPSTVASVRRVMHLMFEYALENGIISTNPVNKTVKGASDIAMITESRFLTRDEQREFLTEAKEHPNYNQFAFILQTGLRYSELTGLKWSDIDGRFLHVNRAAYFIDDSHDFTVGEPKTANGRRTIYLTDEALRLLADEKKIVKGSCGYDDDYIFLSKKGRPITRSTYNSSLKYTAKKIGMKSFSIHKLRHTFATRCVEAGMKPKTLQKIMGHSSVTVTLNYYVHITDNELISEMDKFAAACV